MSDGGPQASAADDERAAAAAALRAAPFGAYRVSGVGDAARSVAAGAPQGFLGKQARSIAFRIAKGKERTPRDVVVFGDQRARLHPYDNVCEKRVYCAPQLWDPAERAAIAALAKNSRYADLIFLDVGANVGLYTLFARSAAMAAGKTFRAACVEPARTVRERLRVNLEASGAADEVAVFAWAATSAPCEVALMTTARNRGETRVAEADETPADDAERVPGRPLTEVIAAAGSPRVDAMKIDVEGHELEAFKGLFEAGDPATFPALIVMEQKRGGPDAALDYILQQGYRVDLSTKMNVVLKRTEEAT
ncbi:MAG: FkbM family methyltransferase [Pseudomonadota bacterium]